jgi:pimeloyl-ACP methyl ester carboxylesterase
MLRRTFVTMTAAAGVSLAASAVTFAQTDADTATPTTAGESMSETAPQTGYAPVNDLEMYYEIHGSGEPLVLLHGAFATIDMWGPVLTGLAENHQVIAVELQGHGHTADIDDRPFSYEQFADDVAALMDHLGIAQADVVGYSMGGTTGLQVAIRHLERVRKLVVVSAYSRLDAYYPEVLAGIAQITPEMFAGSIFDEAYRRNAPNPDNFPRLVEKLVELDKTDFAFPDEELQGITAPVQFIQGDSDVMRPEHAVEMFRLVGGGVPGDMAGLPASQLAILPGTTHITIVTEKTDSWLPMAEAFLAAPVPEGT